METNWKKIVTYVPPKPGCAIETAGAADNKDSRTQPGAKYKNGWNNNKDEVVYEDALVEKGDKFQICADGSGVKILGHRKDGTPYYCKNKTIFPALKGHIKTAYEKVKTVKNIVVDWSTHPKINAIWSTNATASKRVKGHVDAFCRTTDKLLRASASADADLLLSADASVSGQVEAETYPGLQVKAKLAMLKKLGVTIGAKVKNTLGANLSLKATTECTEKIVTVGHVTPPSAKKPTQPTPKQPTEPTPAKPKEQVCDDGSFEAGIKAIHERGLSVSFRNNGEGTDISAGEYVSWSDGKISKAVFDADGNLTATHIWDQFGVKQFTVFVDRNGNLTMDDGEATACTATRPFAAPAPEKKPDPAPAPEKKPDPALAPEKKPDPAPAVPAPPAQVVVDRCPDIAGSQAVGDALPAGWTWSGNVCIPSKAVNPTPGAAPGAPGPLPPPSM